MKKQKWKGRLDAIGRRMDAIVEGITHLAKREIEAEEKLVGRGYGNGVKAERSAWILDLGVDTPAAAKKMLDEGEKLIFAAQRERDEAEAERLRQVGARLDAELALEALSKKVAGAYADRDAARADLQKEVPELKAANDQQKREIDRQGEQIAALRTGYHEAMRYSNARLRAAQALRRMLDTARAHIKSRVGAMSDYVDRDYVLERTDPSTIVGIDDLVPLEPAPVVEPEK